MRRIALLGALAASSAAPACGGPQLVEHPPPAVKLWLPVTLEAHRPHEGDPRAVHVRVWADAGVRALPHWKDDITDQIDYATQLLTPLLGVRIQVDDIKDWDRTGDPHAALAALAAADPGKDVMWVIGYVAPADTASTAMSELGDAQPLGHHVVVRAWAETPETAALAGKLPDVKDAQRAEFLGAHRRHKQTVVLVHELAATLGAIAETDATWIQHLAYSAKQATFSDRNRELMQLAMDARLAETAPDAIAHALLDGIDKAEWGGWVPAQHDEVVAILRNIADSTKAGRTAADVPPAAYEQFDRIRQMSKRKETAVEARAELDNLLTAYPANATMHQLKCELLLESPGPKDPAARAACARVSELAPGDPNVHFAVGEALLKAGDVGAARAELVIAAAKIANLDKGVPDAWRRLVGIYVGLGALTWTEEALEQGKLAGDPAAAVIAQTRARNGLPRGAKFVKPEDENALVEAVREARNLINANKHGEAERMLAAADKKWPGAPGVLAERCELALRGGAVDAARVACDRALRGDPDASWALYLSGVIALKDTSPAGAKTGIDRLKHAIAVDPDLGQAWRALGQAYARTNDKAARQELATAYAAKFGQALPP